MNQVALANEAETRNILSELMGEEEQKIKIDEKRSGRNRSDSVWNCTCPESMHCLKDSIEKQTSFCLELRLSRINMSP